MRRHYVLLAAAALSATLLTGAVSAAAMASAAAAAKAGHERLHAVSHSATPAQVSVSASGVLTATGHFVPRALAGGRITERMVFKRGSFLVTLHVTHHWYSPLLLPPACRFAEHLSGPYHIHGGRGRFTRAAGSGHFYSKINGRYGHHDRTCTGKLVAFRHALTTWGTLQW